MKPVTDEQIEQARHEAARLPWTYYAACATAAAAILGALAIVLGPEWMFAKGPTL
jgi:hypothetical protein